MAKQDGESDASFEAFQGEIGELGGQRTESFTAPAELWTERHRRRLAQTAALPGLLPVVSAQRTNGTATVVQYAPATASLADQLARDDRPEWFESAGVVWLRLVASTPLISTGSHTVR